MDLHVEVQLDSRDGIERGAAIAQWFNVCLNDIFVEAAPRGSSWLAGFAKGEGDPLTFFDTLEGIRNDFLRELNASPYAARLVLMCGEEEIGSMTTVHAMKGGEHCRLTASLKCGSSVLSDPLQCCRLVDSVARALDGTDPAFGRIDIDQFSERANLDVALRRKPEEYLPKSRHVLRGYSWATICPEELIEPLGGVDRIRESGAFARVVRLDRGVLLQSTEAVHGFTYDAMGAVFEVIAPILPSGIPKPHPAFPDIRFVPRDARSV